MLGTVAMDLSTVSVLEDRSLETVLVREKSAMASMQASVETSSREVIAFHSPQGRSSVVGCVEDFDSYGFHFR